MEKDAVEVAPRYLPKELEAEDASKQPSASTIPSVGGIMNRIYDNKMIIIGVLIVVLAIILIYIVYTTATAVPVVGMIAHPQKVPPSVPTAPQSAPTVQQSVPQSVPQSVQQSVPTVQQSAPTVQQSVPTVQQSTQQSTPTSTTAERADEFADRRNMLLSMREQRRKREEAEPTETTTDDSHVVIDMYPTNNLDEDTIVDFAQQDCELKDDHTSSAQVNEGHDENEVTTEHSTRELKQCEKILSNGARCRKKSINAYCAVHASMA